MIHLLDQCIHKNDRHEQYNGLKVGERERECMAKPMGDINPNMSGRGMSKQERKSYTQLPIINNGATKLAMR